MNVSFIRSLLSKGVRSPSLQGKHAPRLFEVLSMRLRISLLPLLPLPPCCGAPQVEDDPLGEKDSFAALPPHEQRTWARGEDAGFGAKLKRLRQLRVTVPIAVRLVGFDGHGAGEVDVKPVRRYGSAAAS